MGVERLGVDDGVTVPCTHDAVAAAIHRSTSNVRGDGNEPHVLTALGVLV